MYYDELVLVFQPKSIPYNLVFQPKPKFTG